MMKFKNILIIYKKSIYEIQAMDHKEPRFLQLLEDKNEAVAHVTRAHKQHNQTMELVEAELRSLNVSYRSVVRGTLVGKLTPDDVDLVISVGGDGTFLEVSHHLDSVPLLGVNSALGSSFGHFCLCNEQNFSAILEQIISGELEPSKLLRLEVTINDVLLAEPVLNEVLVSHPNPAGTSRYFIEIDGIKEEQRSSGIWIGPPAGSTGASRSAGGEVLPMVSPDRYYQYVVREPWPRPGQHWKHLKGLVSEHDEIRIVSGIRVGSLHIDGPHIKHRFNLGDKIVIKGSKNDLNAFINPDINKIFLDDG